MEETLGVCVLNDMSFLDGHKPEPFSEIDESSAVFL